MKKKKSCKCNKILIVGLIITLSILAAIFVWQVNQSTNILDFRGLKGGPALEPGITDTDMSGFTINP